ncbi:MAG: DUF2971 domain-containing protein [Bacteroidetes bacterium]|nr:DUF2971 domain-containing protein [Bacteroidota bacterium]
MKGYQLLNEGKLIFTLPRYFNDIHEFSPSYIDELDNEYIVKYFNSDEILKQVFTIARVTLDYQKDYKEFKTAVFNEPELTYLLMHDRKQYMSYICANFKKAMSEYWCVCCLSDTWGKNIMWAHYANSHKGICVGFEIKNSDIKLLASAKVKYSNDKVVLPYNFFSLGDSDKSKYYTDVTFTKSTEWKEESEVRILSEIGECIHDENSKRYYQELDISDVKSIYLGADYSFDDKYNKLFKEIIGPIDLYKVNSNIKEFSLNRERINRKYVL